jgi:hypothetical protein
LREPASDVLDFLFLMLTREADGERRKAREWAEQVLDKIATSSSAGGQPDRATWGLSPAQIRATQAAMRLGGAQQG